MTNLNQHIEKFLDYYCGLPTAPQYAVMLKGKWGSGKTHYINEYKRILDKKEKKYIYVSLYGLKSNSEILNQFITYYSQDKEKASKLNKSLNKALKIGTNLLSKFSIVEKIMSDESLQLEILEEIPTFKESILIFDDLERCEIDLNKILGFINKFVEHKSFKVIIIANEEELIKKNTEYIKIKEKLIGKSFILKTNFNSAFDYFINKIQSKELKDILTTSKIDIQISFKERGNNNLRYLKQTILDFDRFYENIEEPFRKNKNLMSDLVNNFFIYSFYYKKDNTTKKNTPKESLLLDKKTWEEIFIKSYINIKKIKQQLEESKYFINKDEEWRKVYHFQDLDNDTFDRLIINIEEKLVNKKFTNYFDEYMSKFYKSTMKKEVNELLYLLAKETKILYDKFNNEFSNLPIFHLMDVKKIVKLLISIDKKQRDYFGSILHVRYNNFKEEEIFFEKLKEEVKKSEYSKLDKYKLSLFIESYLPNLILAKNINKPNGTI